MKNFIPVLVLLTLFVISCTDSQTVQNNLAEIEKLQVENDSLKNILTEDKASAKDQIATFLTFQDNNAENAMKFYVGLFDNSRIVNITRWGEEGPGEEGRVMHGIFDLNGSLFMCSDSPPVHNWDFSPAVSNYVECESESEIERLFSKLSEKGNVTMPLGNYGFSQKFGWVIDQFGVSWQLNLE